MRSTTILAALVGASHAFSPIQNHRRQPLLRSSSSVSTSATTLCAKVKRGKLANNVSLDEDGGVKIISNKQKQKIGSAKGQRRNNKKKGDDAAISPLLAEWGKEDSDELKSSPSAKTTVTSSSSADVFSSFDDEESSGMGGKKKKGKKGNNKKNLSVLSAAQSAQMDDLLEQITDVLATTDFSTAELVSDLASLVDMGTSFTKDQLLLPTLKSITAKKPGKDENQPAYRLAWVGSDDAVCHVGTSLHKVPLARLQEIYLLLGYNRWELLEVIRILGPFPNVRNTLKGDLKLKKLGGADREGVRMEVAYNSMIDGTGKEILAGKEDNIKNVGLDVWFANEKAIVCTMVSEDGEEGGGDVLGGNGEKILFFVAEENVDEELEKLRAA